MNPGRRRRLLQRGGSFCCCHGWLAGRAAEPRLHQTGRLGLCHRAQGFFSLSPASLAAPSTSSATFSPLALTRPTPSRASPCGRSSQVEATGRGGCVRMQRGPVGLGAAPLIHQQAAQVSADAARASPACIACLPCPACHRGLAASGGAVPRVRVLRGGVVGATPTCIPAALAFRLPCSLWPNTRATRCRLLANAKPGTAAAGQSALASRRRAQPQLLLLGCAALAGPALIAFCLQPLGC